MRTVYLQKGKNIVSIFFSNFYEADGYNHPCGEKDSRQDEFFNYGLFKEKDNGDWYCDFVKGPDKSAKDFQEEKINEYLSAGYKITVDKEEEFNK